ncbi:MAG: hypothetical protein HFH27_03000 [Clostridiaceae bacterium]|nr:hypothetical protein [Clostridiaceae bacterium]
MKKNFRFLSAVLAACMSLTMFAGAVDTSAETETLTGVAYVVTPEGKTQKPFEYTVPVDATAEEKTELASQAAREAVGGASMAHSMRAAGEQELRSLKYTSIPKKSSSTTGQSLSTGRTALAASGGNLEILLHDISDCTSVNLSFERVSTGTTGWLSGIDVSVDTTAVFISGYKEGYPDKDHIINFKKGDKINTYISGNRSGNGYVSVTYKY